MSVELVRELRTYREGWFSGLAHFAGRIDSVRERRISKTRRITTAYREEGPESHRAPERTSGYLPLTIVQKSATTPSML